MILGASILLVYVICVAIVVGALAIYFDELDQ